MVKITRSAKMTLSHIAEREGYKVQYICHTEHRIRYKTFSYAKPPKRDIDESIDDYDARVKRYQSAIFETAKMFLEFNVNEWRTPWFNLDENPEAPVMIQYNIDADELEENPPIPYVWRPRPRIAPEAGGWETASDDDEDEEAPAPVPAPAVDTDDESDTEDEEEPPIIRPVPAVDNDDESDTEDDESDSDEEPTQPITAGEAGESEDDESDTEDEKEEYNPLAGGWSSGADEVEAPKPPLPPAPKVETIVYSDYDGSDDDEEEKEKSVVVLDMSNLFSTRQINTTEQAKLFQERKEIMKQMAEYRAKNTLRNGSIYITKRYENMVEKEQIITEKLKRLVADVTATTAEIMRTDPKELYKYQSRKPNDELVNRIVARPTRKYNRVMTNPRRPERVAKLPTKKSVRFAEEFKEPEPEKVADVVATVADVPVEPVVTPPKLLPKKKARVTITKKEKAEIVELQRPRVLDLDEMLKDTSPEGLARLEALKTKLSEGMKLYLSNNPYTNEREKFIKQHTERIAKINKAIGSYELTEAEEEADHIREMEQAELEEIEQKKEEKEFQKYLKEEAKEARLLLAKEKNSERLAKQAEKKAEKLTKQAEKKAEREAKKAQPKPKRATKKAQPKPETSTEDKSVFGRQMSKISELEKKIGQLHGMQMGMEIDEIKAKHEAVDAKMWEQFELGDKIIRELPKQIMKYLAKDTAKLIEDSKRQDDELEEQFDKADDIIHKIELLKGYETLARKTQGIPGYIDFIDKHDKIRRYTDYSPWLDLIRSKSTKELKMIQDGINKHAFDNYDNMSKSLNSKIMPAIHQLSSLLGYREEDNDFGKDAHDLKAHYKQLARPTDEEYRTEQKARKKAEDEDAKRKVEALKISKAKRIKEAREAKEAEERRIQAEFDEYDEDDSPEPTPEQIEASRKFNEATTKQMKAYDKIQKKNAENAVLLEKEIMKIVTNDRRGVDLVFNPDGYSYNALLDLIDSIPEMKEKVRLARIKYESFGDKQNRIRGEKIDEVVAKHLGMAEVYYGSQADTGHGLRKFYDKNPEVFKKIRLIEHKYRRTDV